MLAFSVYSLTLYAYLHNPYWLAEYNTNLMKGLLPLALMLISIGASAQQKFPLYPKTIPNSKIVPDSESVKYNEDSVKIVSRITRPTLTVYRPPAGKANGEAIVVCPGGGYGIVALDHEGTFVAKRLTELGITAFVLKYRIPDDQSMINKEIGPLQDAQRAIQFARENARRYRIKSNRIGIMGFSAGGHLASTAGTHFTKSYIPNKKKTSLRPDFLVLVYPVITFTDSIGHKGSMNNLLGNDAPGEKRMFFSNELQVTPETPPSFLVHAKDDPVDYRNSVLFSDALEKNHVKHELYLYEKGGHGFGLNNKTSEVKWIDLVAKWIHDLP
jgi:acetyl esterase/lipase